MAKQSQPDLHDSGCRKAFDAVVNNPLLVRIICSFTSAADLPSLRLLNRIFYGEVRPFLRLKHNPVQLLSDLSVDKWLTLMKTRLEQEQTPFPFTAFNLSLSNCSEDTLQRFGIEAGQHVHRLKFQAELRKQGRECQSKLVVILSRTPNLVEIELKTQTPVFIPNRDQLTFPQTFPQLRVINIDYPFYRLVNYSPRFTGFVARCQRDSIPLFSLLITRATRLNYVGTLTVPYALRNTEELNEPNLLSRYHSDHFPVVGLGDIRINPRSITIIQDLRECQLRFKKLELTVNLSNDVRTRLDWLLPLAVPVHAEIQNFIENVCVWLNNLSTSLSTLELDICNDTSTSIPFTTTFPIPPLAALTELKLKFSALQNVNSGRLFVPLLATNQFPALRSLHLICSNVDTSVIDFEERPLPSVQEFGFQCAFLLDSYSWDRILPNITTLHYSVPNFPTRNDSRNLSYILRHFPRLHHLALNFENSESERWGILKRDYWDILTGGAPRLSTDALLSDAGLSGADGAAVEVNELVNGVYQVPSLGNLRALKTLSCATETRSNVNAIIYMTRIGLLVPLSTISIQVNPTSSESLYIKETYRQTLLQFHKNVNMIG